MKIFVYCTVALIALAGCGGSSSPIETVTSVGDQTPSSEVTLIQDAVSPPDLSDDEDEIDDVDTVVSVADSTGDIDIISTFATPVTSTDYSTSSALVFENSGLIVLPKSLVSADLNDPGAIQSLLVSINGSFVPQAANWTFRALDSGDLISRLLNYAIGFYIPSYSPFVLIVIGDEGDAIDQLIREIFGDPVGTTTGTFDVDPDILTSGASVTTLSSANSSY